MGFSITVFYLTLANEDLFVKYLAVTCKKMLIYFKTIILIGIFSLLKFFKVVVLRFGNILVGNIYQKKTFRPDLLNRGEKLFIFYLRPCFGDKKLRPYQVK